MDQLSLVNSTGK